MKKITFILLLMVAMVTTAMAQIGTNEQFRIKEVSTGLYLNINDHENNTGSYGGVNLANLNEESEQQIFIAEASGEGYKLKANSGYYINCLQWNVNANSTSEGTVLLFEEDNDGYFIKWENNYAGNNLGGKIYFKIGLAQDLNNNVNYVYCDAVKAEAAKWVIEKILATPERTITVATNNNEGGNVTVNGMANEATAEGAITLQATANAGYVFEGWILNGEMISSNTTYVDNTEGNKEYVANFRKLSSEEFYVAIAKPSFVQAGNTTFAEYAAISNGNGIENHSENIVPAELAVKGQNGRTDFIEVEAGATFNLDITYVFNWGDITIVKIENGASEIVYGSFKGEWPNFPEEVVKESMSNAGLTVNEKTVTYPIALSNDLKEGDMVVIRTVTAGNFDLNKQDAYNEGSYMDFVFVVKAKGENTAIENVNVETANDVIYDITGRRVKEITNAGIYIINGKKTFVK